MDTISEQSAILETFSEVRRFSFQEKNSPSINKEKLNTFLDSSIDLKLELKNKTSKIQNLVEDIEKITWFDHISEENLILINDVISTTKDLHTSLLRQYLALKHSIKNDNTMNEIQDFKNSIDELKESYEDLESVFFYLPELSDFKETTSKLSLL